MPQMLVMCQHPASDDVPLRKFPLNAAKSLIQLAARSPIDLNSEIRVELGRTHARAACAAVNSLVADRRAGLRMEPRPVGLTARPHRSAPGAESTRRVVYALGRGPAKRPGTRLIALNPTGIGPVPRRTHERGCQRPRFGRGPHVLQVHCRCPGSGPAPPAEHGCRSSKAPSANARH